MNRLTFCVITFLTVCNCLQLPTSFKKCNRKRSDFNQCLSDVIYDTIRLLDKPLKSHGLPSLYDIEFPPEVTLEFGNSTYGLGQKFSNIILTGLSKPQSVTARLEFDPLISTLTIEASYPELTWQAEYEGQGTIVLLPLNAKTPVISVMENPTFTFTLELEEYTKGTSHFRVIHSGFDMQTHGIKFDFKQLFSNQRLNDEFNSELNEKSLHVFALHKHLQVNFAPHFGSIFSNFLDKVPVAELFD